MGQIEAVDVQLVRWPAESGKRERFRRLGVPRLLVIEGGARAPVTADVQEDWVRAPVSRDDLSARVAALNARSRAHTRPHVDPHGVLWFGGRSTPISPTATDLLQCLVRGYEVLVSREALQDCLPESVPCANRNVLDLHMMRLRKRIKPVGLVIRTVWGRGYLLEPAARPAMPVETYTG
jgi:hypothetical protein